MQEKEYNPYSHDSEQDERFALLAEECAETIQALTKTLRHGYQSYNPFTGEYNSAILHREVGDVLAAIEILIEAGDLDRGTLDNAKWNKLTHIGRWLHQPLPKGITKLIGE